VRMSHLGNEFGPRLRKYTRVVTLIGISQFIRPSEKKCASLKQPDELRQIHITPNFNIEIDRLNKGEMLCRCHLFAVVLLLDSDFTFCGGIVRHAAAHKASARGAVRVSVRVGSCCESLATSECAERAGTGHHR
jgi:hypothetical protein